MSAYDVFVDKYYEPDFQLVDLLFGDELVNGMVVLFAESYLRESVEPDPLPGKLDSLRVVSRWCTVTKIRHRGNTVSFIGEYEDGTKRARSYGTSWGWLVTKDSIPT
jgi:hypothetical protein